jgi:hypothetical protein
MNRIITLEISHPELRDSPIAGFRFLWAFLVSGFRSDRHCQACFRGSLVRQFCSVTVRADSSVAVQLKPQHRFLYVCGVGSGPKKDRGGKNLHLPLAYEPGALVRAETYNGYRISCVNAIEMSIPDLPSSASHDDFTRCKNRRFGEKYFSEAAMDSAAITARSGA